MELISNTIGVWFSTTPDIANHILSNMGMVQSKLSSFLGDGNPEGEPVVAMNADGDRTDDLIEIRVSNLGSMKSHAQKGPALNLLADLTTDLVGRKRIRVIEDSGYCPSVERDTSGSILLAVPFCLETYEHRATMPRAA